ncbi:hypothetical protein TCAL_15991 [Tigriopus californicus]|uniref:Uncharacterized protein n=1 Tax=Tigriopus californicus TaxID=6832 RepID=A0A553PHL4_TIGCA|nr:hypothetical protein TCAL_15991 [Tigriopus californicus]
MPTDCLCGKVRSVCSRDEEEEPEEVVLYKLIEFEVRSSLLSIGRVVKDPGVKCEHRKELVPNVDGWWSAAQLEHGLNLDEREIITSIVHFEQ